MITIFIFLTFFQNVLRLKVLLGGAHELAEAASHCRLHTFLPNYLLDQFFHEVIGKTRLRAGSTVGCHTSKYGALSMANTRDEVGRGWFEYVQRIRPNLLTVKYVKTTARTHTKKGGRIVY